MPSTSTPEVPGGWRKLRHTAAAAPRVPAGPLAAPVVVALRHAMAECAALKTRCKVGLGHTAASETEAPILLANLV
jgi:hypothetical protein